MDKLTYYYQIVEKAIAKLGLNPERTRKEVGKWDLRNKTIPIWLDLYYDESEKNTYFRVVAPFMEIPEDKNPELAWKLLQLNSLLYGVSFTAHNGRIYIHTIREAEGLDISEAYAMILRVGNYAVQYQKELLGIDPTAVITGSANSDSSH